MTHAEDLERIRKQHRLARAFLLARDAQQQLDALKTKRKDPDVEAYRKWLERKDEEE